MRRSIAIVALFVVAWLAIPRAAAAATPCTLLVGYSQTEAIVNKGGFAAQLTAPGQWRYMVNPNGAGGSVQQYADPSFYPYAAGWAAWGSSCDPTRIVLHVTWGAYTSDANAIAAMIPQAILQIRAHWARNATSTSLVAAVSGPGGALCPWTGANPDPTAQPYVRASYNRQAILSAIAQLAGSSGYSAGPVLELGDCGYYVDGIGHWLVDGWNDVHAQSAALARALAGYYNAQDTGQPPPTPTPTPRPSCGP